MKQFMRTWPPWPIRAPPSSRGVGQHLKRRCIPLPRVPRKPGGAGAMHFARALEAMSEIRAIKQT